MKNIFSTIEYVAEKIKEAITGHKNDEQAHPNLNEQINALSNDRGYKETSDKGTTHCDNVIENGKYKGSFEGMPCNGIWAMDVTKNTNNYIYQHARCIYDSEDKGYTNTSWVRQKTDTWNSWEQVATTTKTDILFPFNTGYSGHWASSNKIVKNSLGQCVIYVSVKKTDGSDFTPGIVTIGTLPQGFKSKLNCSVGAYTETTSVGAGAFIYNQDVVNVNVQSNCKVVAFTLFYEVI